MINVENAVWPGIGWRLLVAGEEVGIGCERRQGGVWFPIVTVGCLIGPDGLLDGEPVRIPVDRDNVTHADRIEASRQIETLERVVSELVRARLGIDVRISEIERNLNDARDAFRSMN